MKTLFDKLDEAHWYVGKYDLFPTLNKPSVIRSRIAWLVVASAFCWIWQGWDSCWEMLTPVTNRLFSNPIELFSMLFASLFNWIRGLPYPSDFTALTSEMASIYGIGDHWSAPVIYGLCFIALSIYLERNGVVKSLNFFLTTGLSLGNIGFFELIWNRLYSYFQNQPWTFSFVVPQQIRNLSFFIVFVFFGALCFLGVYGLGYRVHFTKLKAALILVAVGLWLLWVFYPLPISHITISTYWASWTNSNLFPQTFYAVQTTPTATVPFYAPNDLLHLLNVICKAVSATAFTSLCMMVKKK